MAPLSRQAAAFGLLVLSVRLSSSLGASAFEHFDRAPSSRSSPSSSKPSGSTAPSLSPSAIASTEAPSSQITPSSGGHAKKKVTAVRPRRLVVDVGTDRAEVFVDGRRVGQVPYVGEWACASGDAVEITLVPPAGVPTDYRVPCRGEDITVRSEHRVVPR